MHKHPILRNELQDNSLRMTEQKVVVETHGGAEPSEEAEVKEFEMALKAYSLSGMPAAKKAST